MSVLFTNVVPSAVAIRLSGVRRCRGQRFDADVRPVKTKTRGDPGTVPCLEASVRRFRHRKEFYCIFRRLWALGRRELGVMEASVVGRSGWVARFTVETGGRGSGVWRRTRVERMSTCMEKIFDLSKNSLDNEGHKYSCVWVSYHLPLSIAMLERQI